LEQDVSPACELAVTVRSHQVACSVRVDVRVRACGWVGNEPLIERRRPATGVEDPTAVARLFRVVEVTQLDREEVIEADAAAAGVGEVLGP
jgi:hypothetical protein